MHLLLKVRFGIIHRIVFHLIVLISLLLAAKLPLGQMTIVHLLLSGGGNTGPNSPGKKSKDFLFLSHSCLYFIFLIDKKKVDQETGGGGGGCCVIL